MKTISLRCPCGASIQLTDAAESYINPNTGKPNKDGLRYQIEARAESWLNRHQKCLEIKNLQATNSLKKQSEKIQQ